MKNKNWRDVAEIVGIVSIVAGLVLVAWEVRQANNIATTQMVMDLAAQANEFNSATFENAEVAELVAAIYDPNHSEYTDAQQAMMSAVAWHIENMPAMRPWYKVVYNTAPWLRDMFVFQPLVELACGSRTPCGDLTTDN